MSDEEKHGHNFDLPLFFNMSKQLLVPGGLNAECFQVSVMQTWGLQGFKALRPEKLQMF